MDRDPYRAEVKLDAKLEKLAAEGRQRIADAAAKDTAAAVERASSGDRNRNIRAALGGYYGSPLRSFLTLLLVSCIVLVISGIVLGIAHTSLPRDAPLAVAGRQAEHVGWVFGLAVIGFPITLSWRLLMTPLATRARVAAERAWVSSLPIGLDDGYFQVLALAPRSERRLEIVITAKDRLPAQNVLEGVVGVADPKARVVSSHGNVVTIMSGSISGDTGVSVSTNGGPSSSVLRNDNIVAYVHDFVRKVLLPLHESVPLSRVTFRSEN